MGYGQILHQRGKEEDQVNLNVGDLKRSLCSSTLKKFPDTRLGKLLACDSEEDILQVCDDYDVQQKEFYFDRNPGLFPYVLHFYQTGKLHVMEELCVFSFSQEIEYWGIHELHLSPCCHNFYHERKEYIEDRDWDLRSDDQQEPSFNSSFEELSALDKDLAKFKGACCAELRSYIWLRLEDPGHSTASKVIAVASLSVVLTSIVAMCIHSMPEFQRVDNNEKPIEDPVLTILEEICIACFSAEFVIRLIVAPSRRKFLGNPLNIIDVASILPFYATLALETTDEDSMEENEDLENLPREKEEKDTDLGTIPSGWWWAMITMTTVGYGDTCPVTLAGKLAATLCIICGLLVVALPITIIFNKFSKYYQRNKAMEGRGITKPERQDPELPHYNIKELFTGSVYPFIGSIAFRNSVSSRGDDTDASSLQDIEVCDNDDTCENGE
uniref:Potassium voltage-gated channel, delayed-rectifier, subfamily S, member 3 n=1 Tax=Nothobranchius pienaari TaxID=704102 RepID=A0A1A8MPR9_9TELE